MGKWKTIKEWNDQREKGLKNSTILWFWSLVVTFLLTVLPSIFISFISKEDRSGLYDLDIWIKVAVDNLYPMMVTQSVVTILQNFSIISPPLKKNESKCYPLHFGWTAALIIFLLIYIFVYPLLVLAAPPKLNAFLFAISGALSIFGLISIWQLDKEQEISQKKHREGQKDRAIQNGGRSLSAISASDVLSNAGDGSPSKDGMLV